MRKRGVSWCLRPWRPGTRRPPPAAPSSSPPAGQSASRRTSSTRTEAVNIFSDTVKNIFIGKDGLLTIGTHHIDNLLEVALHEVHDPVPGGGVKILHLPCLQRQVYIVLFVRLENGNMNEKMSGLFYSCWLVKLFFGCKINN